MAKEMTGAQIASASVFTAPGIPPEPLVNPLPKSYKTYREMRKHPTLALARKFSAAVVVAGEWSVESKENAPEGAVKFITEQVMRWRRVIVERSMLGGNIDFGWQPFEVVYDVKDGAVVIVKVKPLLHDITEILVFVQDGAFAAFRQLQTVEIPAEQALLVSFQVEGTQWYGESSLENARDTFNEWREANAGAARYDKKLAGTHLVVTYPVGSTPDGSGTETDNATLAKAVIAAMQSNGAVAIPRISAEHEGLPSYSGDKFKNAWSVEFMSDKGAQASFVERQAYLDKQLVRALGFPERAILEGRFGTKAEAGVHQDLAVINFELVGDTVCNAVNEQVIRHLMRLNYGEEQQESVWIKQSPLTDAKIEKIWELYKKLLENPAGFAEEFGDIDMSAMRKMLGIPETKTADDVEPDLLDDDSTADDDSLITDEMVSNADAA